MQQINTSKSTMRLRFWSSYYLSGALSVFIFAVTYFLWIDPSRESPHLAWLRITILTASALLIIFFGNRGLVFVQISSGEIRFRPFLRPWTTHLRLDETAEVRLHQRAEMDLEMPVPERTKTLKRIGAFIRGPGRFLLPMYLRNSGPSVGEYFVLMDALDRSGHRTRLATLPLAGLRANRSAYAKLISFLQSDSGAKLRIDAQLKNFISIPT